MERNKRIMRWKFWKDWFCKEDRLEFLTLEDFDGSRNQKSSKIFLAIARKYAGNFAMIPANLDIDRLIERFPLINYKFWKKRGVDVIYSKEGTKFDKDRLAYIIGLISSIPASNKDSITEDGYVCIYSKYIQKFFRDYRCYLDYLIDTGVLVSDDFYIEGEKSIGYKFAPAYENTPLKRHAYSRKSKELFYEAVPKQVYNKDIDTFEDNLLTKFEYLAHWYGQKKLTISPGARQYAWRVMQRKFADGYTAWDDNHDKWNDKHNRYFKKHPRSQYNAAMHNISVIETGTYNAKVDSNVHRLHSAITNMQKDYRNFLRYDGKELTAIDISNSQPFLLCILFNPAFWDKDSDAYINIGNLPENIQNRFSDELLADIKMYVESIPEDSKSEYIIKASSGEVYKFMMDKANEQYPDCCKDKTDAKIMMLIAFFSSNKFLNQKGAHLKKVFSQTFPEIYELIRMSKVNDKSDFACLLQSVESEIILHRCCKRIWDEGEHKVPVFTIHDSIATTAENVEFVKHIMDEELYKAAGVHPHFKTETWSEDNLQPI